MSKASEMEGFLTTLTRLEGSAEAGQAKLAKLASFAANTPFELPGVVQAGISLKSLGVDVDKFLPLAGDLASVFNKDITEGALALGKALSGSQDGIQILADTYGISRKQMIEFGAAAKADGSIAVETASDLEKLRGALEKIVSSKYGGAMEAQSKTLAGTLSNLSDAVGQFGAEMGNEFAPMVKDGAELLGSLVGALREMDPATKGMMASTLLAGTALAGIGAIIAGLVAILGPAAASYVFLSQVTREATAEQAAKALAAQAAAVADAEAALAAQAAAAAQVEEALALQATVVSEAEAIVATELLTAAEVQLAAATEAAAIAQGNLAASSGGAAAASGLFAKGLAGANAAAAAIPLSLGPALLIIGLVAGAVALYISHLSAATAAQEAQIQASEAAQDHYRKERDVILAATEAIREYGSATDAAVDQVLAAYKRAGKTDLDAHKALAGLMDQLRQVEAEQGEDSPAAKKLRENIELQRQAMLKLRGTYQEQEKARSESETKAKKAEADRLAAIEDYKKKASAGFYATAKDQLAALDQVLKISKKTDKDYADMTLDRVKLARKASEDQVKAEEETRKKTIDGELHKLDLIVGADEAHIKKRLALLDELLKRTDLNVEERQRLEVDQKREEEALDKARADSRKKAEEKKTKDAKEAADARAKVRESESKVADEELANVREAYQQGKATADQLKEQIDLHGQLEAKIRLEKAAQEGLGKSSKAKAELIKAAELENAAAAQKTAREKEGIDREASKRKAKEAETDAEIKAEQAKSDEDALKQQLAAGGKVGDKLLDQVKSRQKAEQDSLIAKAEAQKMDASAADQAQIDKQLQLDLLQLKRQQKAEIREITEEIKRQKAEQTEKKDGFTLGKISTDVNDTSAFDITKKDDAGKDGKKLAEVLADQAAAQAETDQVLKQELTKKEGQADPDKSSPASDRSKDKSSDKSGDKKPEKHPDDATKPSESSLAPVLERLDKISSQLAAINQEQAKPTKLVREGGASSTERPDWRTSTNKQQGAF